MKSMYVLESHASILNEIYDIFWIPPQLNIEFCSNFFPV